MDDLELSVSDLHAQITALHNGNGAPAKIPSVDTCPQPLNKWYTKYIVYVVLFFFIVIVVLVFKPSFIYKEDPDNKTRNIVFSRVFGTVIVVFVILLLILIAVPIYAARL